MEDARRKKAKEAEVAEKQHKRSKHGKGDQEEDDSDANGDDGQQKGQMQVPSEVNGALTHSTVAIFEALETCDGDYLNNMNGSGFTGYYRGMLPVSLTPSDPGTVLDKGPLAILHEDEAIANDQEQKTWSPPKWWDECSKKLERTCVANIPEETSPSFFVGP